MFFLGFLLAGAIFVAVVVFVSLFLPGWKSRLIFVIAIFGFVIGYPYLHLVRPSYAMFKELCARPSSTVIVHTRKVNFILLDAGFPSDCTNGPSYVADSSYLGFDCNMRVGVNSRGEALAELRRYTKKPGATAACGLECFVSAAIDESETPFGFRRGSRTRGGYVAGEQRIVTNDYPLSRDKEIPFWQWLRFTDNILVDAKQGDMAFTTQYYYLPYGPITILGLASGSAPSESCPRPKLIDPRTVYHPARG